jgi:hypothetical protein
MTHASCAPTKRKGDDLYDEEIVGAFRVKGVRGVVLVAAQSWMGAVGATLYLWRDSEAVELVEHCAGSG